MDACMESTLDELGDFGLTAFTGFSLFVCLQRIVADAHEQGKRLRPAGNALSPNGIALSNEEMVSLRMMDKVSHSIA